MLLLSNSFQRTIGYRIEWGAGEESRVSGFPAACHVHASIRAWRPRTAPYCKLVYFPLIKVVTDPDGSHSVVLEFLSRLIPTNSYHRLPEAAHTAESRSDGVGLQTRYSVK